MMISPDSYYEFYLKGKPIKEIMTCIRSLKNEIRRQKKCIETPHSGSELFIKPGPETIIAMNREYLEYAKKAFTEAGGIYTPSHAELKAMKFDEDINHIRTLKFTIGGYFGGYETRIVTVNDDSIGKDIEHSPYLKPSNAGVPYMPFDTKEEFFEGLRNLHLNEWKHHYNDPDICDGTDWNLEITFNSQRKPFKCSGSNAFPYNFDELLKLMGCTEDEG